MDDILETVNKRQVVIGVENIAERILKSCEVCHQQFSLIEFISHKKVHRKECLPSSNSVKIEKVEDIIFANGHEHNLNYTCSICTETFSKETLLRIHQIQKHSFSLVACLRKAVLPKALLSKRQFSHSTSGGSSGGSSGGTSRGSYYRKGSPRQNLKRFKCRYCEKLFLLPSQCKSHENSHVVEPILSDSVIAVENLKNSSLCSDPNVLPSDFAAPGESVLSESSHTHTDGCHDTLVNDLNTQESDGVPSLSSFPSLSPPSFAPEIDIEPERPDQDMESQSTNSTGSLKLSSTLEMPKLIIPTHLHRLNTFTAAIGGDTNRVYLTNFGPIKRTANETEPRINFISNGTNPLPSFSPAPALTNVNANIPQKVGDGKFHKCLDCGQFYNESQIFAHVKSHLTKGQKQCPHCEFASGDLQDHLMKHYDIKPYKCPVCPKVYGWLSGLKKHMSIHGTQDKAFKCSHCTLTFQTRRECGRHEVTQHQGNNGFIPKKKRQRSTKITSKVETEELPRHVHDGNSQFYVPDPSSAQHGNFSQAVAVPSHEPHYQYPVQDTRGYASYPAPAPEVFNQQQPYYTNPSGGSYNNDTHFSQQPQPQQPHGEIENAWAPIPESNSNYTAYTNELPHVNSHNWNEQQSDTTAYVANHSHSSSGSNKIESEFSFQEPEDLRESETCKSCGEQIQLRDLSAHILAHILPGQKSCTLCKYKCNTKIYLAEHYNIHYGLTPYSCSFCNRKFAMRSYLRSHVQQVHDNESSRRYQCRHCDKRFVRSCHLRTHEIIHEGQGEIQGESMTHPGLDSDSNSNSNASFRTPVTTERRSSTTTSSPSNHGIYSRSNTNSPQSTQSSISSLPSNSKSKAHWNGVSETEDPPAVPPTPVPWPQYHNHSGNYEQNGWNSWYSNSPLVKSDVNWTEPLYDSPWQQPQGQQHLSHGGNVGYNNITPTTPSKLDYTWSDSSNGFYSGTTSSCSTIPPSSSVQDLWAELHFEEMKWFPESSSSAAFTSDGIPMITELAPLDGFSYTEMLNNATADLPLFGSSILQLPEFQDSTGGGLDRDISGLNFQETKVDTGNGEASNIGNWKGQTGPRKGRNTKGRGRGTMTAEAKHKLKQRLVKRISESEEDFGDSLSGFSKDLELSGEEEDDDDPDTLDECLTCHEQVQRKHLLMHIRGHLVSGQRTCDVCQRTYCNAMTLKEHIHIHYKLKPYKCAFCDEKYSSKYSRKTHEVFTHEQRKSSIALCPYEGCGKPYAMRSELQKHLRAHAKRNDTIPASADLKPIVKPADSKPNVRPADLKTNVKASDSKLDAAKPAKQTNHVNRLIEDTTTALNIKAESIKDVESKTWEVRLEDIGRKMTKKCPLCDEEILLADFYEHKQGHREPCHICQKPIPVTEILKHGPTHVGIGGSCEICGWKSKQRAPLWEHMNGTHLKIKPIRCLYCGQGFSSRNSLRSHYLAIHTKFRPHSCRYCGKPFVQHSTMIQHELIHLGKQCPSCPQTFPIRKELHLHLREIHGLDY